MINHLISAHLRLNYTLFSWSRLQSVLTTKIVRLELVLAVTPAVKLPPPLCYFGLEGNDLSGPQPGPFLFPFARYQTRERAYGRNVFDVGKG